MYKTNTNTTSQKSVIIERIEINAFAGLKEVLVEPAEGINLITAPNESGKSTLAAFIKFIFYGFAGTRQQSISDNEKKKYLPWDMQHVGGAIVISTPRGRYRIERVFALPSRDSVTIIDTATGRQVFSGLVPGEHFFGVGEEVFSKSVFFRQLFVPQNGDDQLAEQLRNLIFSADEQTSLTKAQKKLKDAKNSLVSRTNGKIPALRREYDELSAEFDKAESQNTQVFFAQKQLNRVRADVSDKKTQLDKVRDEKDNLDNYREKLRLEAYNKQEKELAATESELEELKAKFVGGVVPDRDSVTKLEEDTLKLNSATQSLKENENYLANITDQYNQLCSDSPLAYSDADSIEVSEKYSKAKNLPILFLSVAAFCGIASGATYFFRSYLGNFAPYIVYGLMALAGVFGILFVISLIKFLRFGSKFGIDGIRNTKHAINDYPSTEARVKSLKRDISEAERKLTEKREFVSTLRSSIITRLSSYIDPVLYNFDDLSAAVRELSARASDARTKLMLFEQSKKNFDITYKSEDMAKIKTAAEKAVKPVRTEEEIEREFRFLTSALNSLLARERECENELTACSAKAKNPAELAGKRDSVKRSLESLEKKAEALDAALIMLDTASSYMKSTISPKLTEYASELFENASLGRYRTLEVDSSLNMTFSSRVYTKSTEFMSAGTKDSAYLCLRLALAKLLYRDSVPPLILDDAFGKLDDGRLGAMLGIVASYGYSENRDVPGNQVFLFTCTDRERESLLKQKIEFTELSLTDNILPEETADTTVLF